jgi:hypothetical protein
MCHRVARRRFAEALHAPRVPPIRDGHAHQAALHCGADCAACVGRIRRNAPQSADAARASVSIAGFPCYFPDNRK